MSSQSRSLVSKRGTKTRNRSRGSQNQRTYPNRISRMTLGDMGQLASDLWDGAKWALPMLNVEVKRSDTNTNSGVSGAGAVTPLTLLAQGVDYNQRDGISIRAVALESRLSIEINAAAQFDEFRIIYFVDHENRGASPVTPDLLEVADVRSAYNHLTLERFEILHDELCQLSQGGPQVLDRVIKIPLKHHVRYTGAGGAIANALEGQIFYFVMSQQAINTAYNRVYTRFSYVDN